MKGADRRKFLVGTSEAHDQDFTGSGIGERHVDKRRRIGVAPKAKKSSAAGRELARRAAPCVRRHDDPRPRTAVLDALAFDRFGE